MTGIEKGGLYQNWDGKVYKVIDFGINKVTNEKVVIYQLNISTIANGGYEPAKYTMSIDSFLEQIGPNMDGSTSPRFTKVDNV